MCGIYAVISERKTLDETDQAHIDLVSNRGPDANSYVTIDLENGLYLHMTSYVLHLRGDIATSQPCEHGGNVLQWNGEIFGGIDIPETDSDTKILSQRLAACQTDSELCDVISSIQGPWAFVYFQKSTKQLWFGRDYIGRRSLLFHHNKTDFILASVARKSSSWKQVSADGIYKMGVGGTQSIVCHQWRSITKQGLNKYEAVAENDKNYVNDIIRSAAKNGLSIFPPITNFCPKKCHSFPEINKNSSNAEILTFLLENYEYSNYVQNFLENIRQSVKKRVKNIPKRSNCPASLGLLFSGGIDCTVLALVADEFVPQEESIVLLNVAFETPKSGRNFDVPDRITGRTALKELQALRPNRSWIFEEINVTIAELKTARNDVIADLTHPLVTVLDDSIGCALWFAARGVANHFTSYTKVVLSGLGADEQLGGYSRHRSAFERSGREGFEREIMLEIERLSTRNLGRDDRIVSHHGKEARFPYLDENVMSFLNETPTEFKANFFLKRGLGEKILLRAVGFRLGLRETAFLPKRAIQFGSRIAKSECRKEKASDLCERLIK